MIGKIKEIIDNVVIVELTIDITNQPNIVGLHIILEDDNNKIVAEIESVNKVELRANIVGEFAAGRFSPGSTNKPSFKSNIRIINMEELELLLGKQQVTDNEFHLGISNIYQNYHINVNINSFFSNHFAILGNSGSGKSFTVSGFFQRLFTRTPNPPVGANIFLFDAYGEYTKAFTGLHDVNPKLNYKVYTTNTSNPNDNIIRIPLWLLDVDDLALLLDANTPNQLPIIEKTLKLVPVLIGNSPVVIKHKNDIIARALQDIMLSGDESTKIRDQVTAVLTKFNTEELNLKSQIVQPGYTRTLSQCLYIDKTGKMQEMELVVNFISSFIDDNLTLEMPATASYYTLKDLEEAMEFALISEGMLKSDKVYDMANVLLVRLHSLANSPSSAYFTYPKFIDISRYIAELLTNENNAKCQIVNFNINYVDDRLAKVITKIISRLLFKQAVNNPKRGSIPFHIVIEEAHRYVQKDIDTELLGYNIFERITKEGRKYGVILGLITQRPSELSDTVISQCSNFVILRMSHPKDLDYIKMMIPNISLEIVEKIKNQKSGNCVAFGTAFKVPVAAYIEMPNPEPLSNNVDMIKVWHNPANPATSLVEAVPEINSNVVNTAPPSMSLNQAQYKFFAPPTNNPSAPSVPNPAVMSPTPTVATNSAPAGATSPVITPMSNNITMNPISNDSTN